MTLPGKNTIRQDLYNQTVDTLPQELPSEKYEDAAGLRHTELVSPPGRAVTTPVRSLSSFYSLFQKVITAAEQEDAKNYNLSLVEEYPPIETSLPCLSVRLVDKSPFRGQRGTSEYAPRPMEKLNTLDGAGNITEVFYIRQQNLVEITVWAKTNKTANEIAEWVEEKFFEYLGFFEWSGLGLPIRFEGRLGDTTMEPKGQLIHARPLRFSVVTGRITKRSSALIRRVGLKIGVLKP